MSHQLAVGFLDEVNPDTAPDYYEVVRRPLSFQDIMAKCREGAYNDSGSGGCSSSGLFAGAERFAADVRHIFKNCRCYNNPGSSIDYQRADLSAMVSGSLYLEVTQLHTY